MKRANWVLLACAALLFCLPLRALAAINFDGQVEPGEWFDYPAMQIFSSSAKDYSQCGITSATVRFAVQPEKAQVMFGFTAVAPGIEAGSPVGAAFLLGTREIGRWQQGQGLNGSCFDAANYDLRGLARIPPDSYNGGYSFEIALGYKNEAALSALRELTVQLFDPLGVPSRPAACSVTAPEPVTTTTTERPTTTTTTRTTTTTTTKTATTLPVYTTAPPAYTPAPQASAPAQAANPTFAAADSPTTAQQAGTGRTETVWYTVVYTAAPDSTDAAGQPVPWTYDPLLTDSSQAQTLPTLAAPEPQEGQPASRSAPLLYAAIALLVLLAGVLIVFWLRAQKQPEEERPPEEET